MGLQTSRLVFLHTEWLRVEHGPGPCLSLYRIYKIHHEYILNFNISDMHVFQYANEAPIVNYDSVVFTMAFLIIASQCLFEMHKKMSRRNAALTTV